jgi:hypothetical protein
MREYRNFVRYGFDDGRARYSMWIASWSQYGVVYAVAWAAGHLLLEKEA